MDIFTQMKLIPLLLLLVAPIAEAQGTLSGIWKSGCVALPKRHSVIAKLDLNRNLSGSGSLTLFVDKNCGNLSLRIDYDLSLSLSGPFGEGIASDLIISKATMLILNPEVMDYYNDNRICGYADWKLSEPREISGRFCRPFQVPPKNQAFFDITEPSGDQLRFGNFPEGKAVLDPGQRPSRLQSAFTFLKQPK